MKDALDRASSLYNERKSRPTGLHAPDKRIATEIASSQFDLMQLKNGIKESNQQYQKQIEDNILTMDEIEVIHDKLQKEMDIVNFRRLPDAY